MILSMVALGFSKDTKMSILLKSISTERLKNIYAARGASLYALAKLSIDDNVSDTKDKDKRAQGAAGIVAPGDFPKAGAAPIGANAENDDHDSEDIEGDQARKRNAELKNNITKKLLKRRKDASANIPRRAVKMSIEGRGMRK